MGTQKNNSEKTNEELLIEYKENKEIAVKQELVMRYVYIVRSVALQMRDVYLNFAQLDDIVNEGVLAVMNALDKFDLEMNVKFETYISKRIRGMIIDLARRQDWIPRSVRKSAKDIDNATMELYNSLGRFPTSEEVAEFLNISIEKYYSTLGKTNLFNVLSLDMVLEETLENKKNVQLISDNLEEQPEVFFMEKETHKLLVKAIKSLKENEQIVISLYYVNELNMKEIARVLEVSEPRISQIHANAIRKLRIFMKMSLQGESGKE